MLYPMVLFVWSLLLVLYGGFICRYLELLLNNALTT